MKKRTKEKPIKIPKELPCDKPKLDLFKIPIELKVREPKGIPILKAPLDLPIIPPNEIKKNKSKDSSR